MTTPSQIPPPAAPQDEAVRRDAAIPRKPLSAAAERALAEAEARRLQAAPPPPREINGRDGPDPVRYGDWEVKGIASDF